jgi:hypothetical protein
VSHATPALALQVIGPDKHGIKTVIEFKIKEDGTKARSRPAAPSLLLTLLLLARR